MNFKHLILFNKNTIKMFLPAFFLISCTSTPPEEKEVLKESQIYHPLENVDETFLTMSPKEVIEIKNSPGIVWAPFVLPLKNYTQTNASLYLGMVEKINDLPKTSEISGVNPNNSQYSLILPPKEGECSVFQEMPILQTDKNNKLISSQKQLYVFENITKQKRINTSLFFILDDDSHVPIAVARLNSHGKSKCFLPVKPYSITIGYGRKRNEIHIDGKSRIVKIAFPKVSALRVTANKLGINIKTGDLIRIGRKYNIKFTNQIMDDFPKVHLNAKIQPDLYNNADMGSHDFSVDEFIKTSFLVGKSNFQIELEPGDYVAAVIRKSKLVCLNTIVLKPDSNFDISCRNQQREDDIAYQFQSVDSIFDVGFRPKSLLSQRSFVEWIVDTPGAILIGPAMLDKDATSSASQIDPEDFFSIIYKNKSKIQQTSYGASISESLNYYKIPLKGMSQVQLLDGQVPFSEHVVAKSRNYLVPYFLNKTSVIYTNGAEISILEPTMTNKGSLYITNNQEFLIRVVVPKWNSTRVLEMYVDGELFKRWLLDRDEIKNSFSSTLRVNTYESKNFHLKFIAHGESPLPNFLTGRETLMPYAETKEFCVSLDGKDQCS